MEQMEASVLFELVFDLAVMVDLMFWELFLWYLALKLGTTSFPGKHWVGLLMAVSSQMLQMMMMILIESSFARKNMRKISMKWRIEQMRLRRKIFLKYLIP